LPAEALIADEPTTALDVMVRPSARLSPSQRDNGLALLFITHDLSVLTTTCKRLAVMPAGRIVERAERQTASAAPARMARRSPASRRSATREAR
jgi:ABC-type dipeptide/oligopeptide/nickel transport system ATPase component